MNFPIILTIVSAIVLAGLMVLAFVGISLGDPPESADQPEAGKKAGRRRRAPAGRTASGPRSGRTCWPRTPR